MFSQIKRRLIDWRRWRRLNRIRRAFAQCGYPLDHLDDSGVKDLLTGGEGRIEDVPLTAKTIYFALRRLSPSERTYLRGRRKNAPAAQNV
jgi:hypothetical protein